MRDGFLHLLHHHLHVLHDLLFLRLHHYHPHHHLCGKQKVKVQRKHSIQALFSFIKRRGTNCIFLCAKRRGILCLCVVCVQLCMHFFFFAKVAIRVTANRSCLFLSEIENVGFFQQSASFLPSFFFFSVCVCVIQTVCRWHNWPACYECLSADCDAPRPCSGSSSSIGGSSIGGCSGRDGRDRREPRRQECVE